MTCAEGSDETSTGGICHDLDMPGGTYVTYAVAAVDPAGNESALSAPLVVRTGDRVAPGPVTGVQAVPRADGVLVSWAASDEDDVERHAVWTGARQADGTVTWLGPTSCREGTSGPLAVLCGDLPDGETYVYAVVARDLWATRCPRATRRSRSSRPPNWTSGRPGPSSGTGTSAARVTAP
ncbi:hypothetical protein [Streptomyces sp. NPDC048737]|uniref:hypothetical protein n=1 Tax=unclassified Streptomyces TaxID=2593676 RepID=UPI00343FE0EA